MRTGSWAGAISGINFNSVGTEGGITFGGVRLPPFPAEGLNKSSRKKPT